MKGGFAAAAVAALATGANAAAHQHRHAHELFKKGMAGTGLVETYPASCSTIWTTVTGEPTLCPPATTEKKTTSSAPPPPPPTTTTTMTSITSTHTEVVEHVPTPEVHTCPTPGDYTFPATTITVHETTTVCGAETAKVTPGPNTVGGVTTIVKTATTVTCPVATVETNGGVATSTVKQTEYVCPSAGTYTIGAHTTNCGADETEIVYPVPTTYAPGTYTRDQQVVHVTVSNFVTVCPFSSAGQSTPTAVKIQETPKPAPTTEKKETPKPKPTSEAPKKQPSNGSGLTGSNDHFGMTYTPYSSTDGSCKSASEVEKDIAALKQKGFQVVRIYSTDCDTLKTVPAACKKHGMELIVGVFIKESGCSYNTPDIKEQVDAIAEWAQWDMTRLIVIGNEAMMNGYCTVTQLTELIKTVKSKCSGYNGPYTTTETLNIWQGEGVAETLCGEIDVTGANIQPFFNSGVDASGAGKFVAGQLDILKKICPGNDVINLECGWPKRGDCNGKACPSADNQKKAISSIREATGDKTIFFTKDDDHWKGSVLESSFGAGDCFQ